MEFPCCSFVLPASSPLFLYEGSRWVAMSQVKEGHLQAPDLPRHEHGRK
ncbi:hypothetical protein HMPREF1556_01897 [Porphyromonas sp. oral taxon 278 str. W7784]|nr:hypothetical protein HMPREF1556_01897 [Porphyromonas sp. oral taxon 278 str. W7784]